MDSRAIALQCPPAAQLWDGSKQSIAERPIKAKIYGKLACKSIFWA